MIKPSQIKPMQDWQRVLLEDNIALYYAAMKRYGASRHISSELGNAVILKLCASMNKFDPNKSSISTFIFMQVRYSISHAKREYAYECKKQIRIADAMRTKNEYCFINNGHYRSGDLEDALKKIPLRMKTVVDLHYNKQMSITECGAVMGVSKQRFTQLLEIARTKLAKFMSTMKGSSL